MILAEGLRGVRLLREAFPGVTIVADLKTMDGGYLKAEMMAKAGATYVVVMARTHEETIKCVVQAGCDFGVKVRAIILDATIWFWLPNGCKNPSCDYVIHYNGHDERRGIAAHGLRMPSLCLA